MGILSEQIPTLNCLAGLIAALILVCPIVAAPPAVHGRVVDGVSHQPVNGAWVVLGTDVTRTDLQGRFELSTTNGPVSARVIGYSRAQLAACPDMTIALDRLRVRGLYLSFWGVGSTVLRDGVSRPRAKLT